MSELGSIVIYGIAMFLIGWNISRFFNVEHRFRAIERRGEVLADRLGVAARFELKARERLSRVEHTLGQIRVERKQRNDSVRARLHALEGGTKSADPA